MFRYSKRQIILHWGVVGLLIAQYLLADAMSDAFRHWMREGQVGTGAGVAFHITLGVTVLALALWRIVLHLREPSPPREGLVERGAEAIHWLLYALLVAIPLAGLIAWFGSSEAAGEVHEVLTSALLWLAGLHVAAALYHQFWLRDGLLRRVDPR